MKGAVSVATQFAIGLTFGLGLVVAGMSDPAKVLNFLDLAAIPSGGWDPSLAFVLAGAVAVTAVGFRLVLRRSTTLLGGPFQLPTATAIDGSLLAGAAIFGAGWGLAGFCPGPAFTALGGGSPKAFLFVAAILAGMLAARQVAAGLRPAAAPSR